MCCPKRTLRRACPGQALGATCSPAQNDKWKRPRRIQPLMFLEPESSKRLARVYPHRYIHPPRSPSDLSVTPSSAYTNFQRTHDRTPGGRTSRAVQAPASQGCCGEHVRRSVPPGAKGATPFSAGETRRLPGVALIKREVGLGLFEEVPVRHRLGCLVPVGRSACGRDRGWTRRSPM
jgi:hypothetical protein